MIQPNLNRGAELLALMQLNAVPPVLHVRVAGRLVLMRICH